MKCKTCGNEVKDGAVFCAVCGSRLMVEGLRSKHETAYLEVPLEITKPQKKENKKSSGCGGCLVSLIIIILLVIGSVKGVSWYREYVYNKVVEKSLLVNDQTVEELDSASKKQDWNNDGIINEEAEKRGLNITADDSDGDGLSDYDEINIYKSNPLKYSTADDIYSDGYKVFLGYDLKKRYETFTILETVNPKVKVEIDNAYDMQFVYKEYHGLIPEGYYLGFQPFRLFSFSGEINVELDNPNNYQVLSYDIITNKIKKISSKQENENLVFTVKDDNPILIVYKDSVIKKMDSSSVAMINGNYDNEQKKEYFVVAFPFLTKIFKQPIYIFEFNNGLAQESDETIADDINGKIGDKFSVKHHYTNEKEIEFIEGLLGQLDSEVYNNVANENKTFVDYIVVYKRVSSEEELYEYLNVNFGGKEKRAETVKEKDKKENNINCTYCADSGFKVDSNAFVFQNVKTKKSTGGVGMGFSYMTTQIYNNGGIPKSLEDIYIMDSDSYTTIWNKNLYNYKPTEKALMDYADEVKNNEEILNSKKMNKPDSEVVKALEYYDNYFNDRVRLNRYGWEWNSSFEKYSYIEEDTIKKVIKEFKEGKIVSVVLLSDKQHALNAYKIVEDEDDSDILYLKVYDSNFPNDMFFRADSSKKVKYDINITLKRVYERTWSGTKVKYVYYYNPINSDKYKFETLSKTYDGILFVDTLDNVL